MRLARLDTIVVPENRQRRLFDPAKLHEFGDNIAKRGLLHPIILREVEGALVLVAGERRLRAISDLADLGVIITHDLESIPLGQIPYTLFSDLDPIAAEEAEFDENIHRVDLTWQERAAVHHRFAALRTTQAEARGERPPLISELVAEVEGEDNGKGLYQEQFRRDVAVARHLDNPLIAGAKTVDEAFKILKRSEETEKNRALGVSVGRNFTANVHRCLNTDTLTWLKECPAESFDVILTDPPYGMGADTFGDSGGLAAGAHAYADDAELLGNILRVCPEELFRVTKPAAHLYWFCDIDAFTTTRVLFSAAGWQVFRTPLIFHKPSGARAPWPEHGPQRKYELCLYAIKGKRRALRVAPDLVSYPADSNLGHAAQKPVALFEDFLRRSVLPGNTVLDPFCGTGTIFPAAHALKCAATGLELDTSSYGIAVARIETLKAQMELDLELGV